MPLGNEFNGARDIIQFKLLQNTKERSKFMENTFDKNPETLNGKNISKPIIDNQRKIHNYCDDKEQFYRNENKSKLFDRLSSSESEESEDYEIDDYVDQRQQKNVKSFGASKKRKRKPNDFSIQNKKRKTGNNTIKKLKVSQSKKDKKNKLF